MTTKKILVTIGGVVLGLGFLAVCFVGGIVGFSLYAVNRSEAASRARDFLRNNEKLRSDIGTVKDFGSIVTANVKFYDDASAPTMHLKVIGERKTVNATVKLLLRNREWSVIGAYYVNSSGQTVPLLDPYDAKITFPLLVA